MKLHPVEWVSVFLSGVVAAVDVGAAVTTCLRWAYLSAAAAWLVVIMWTITSARWRELARDLLKSNGELLDLNARLLARPWEDN